MKVNGKTYKVSDLMREPLLIQRDAHLKDVLLSLLDGKTNIGCVVDEDGHFVGAVTTVDVIRAILPDYIESDEVAARFADESMLKEDVLKAACHPISEFIEEDETTVSPDTQLLEATVLSSKDCNGRIVVTDEDNKPVGILSRTQIKRALVTFLDVRDELTEC